MRFGIIARYSITLTLGIYPLEGLCGTCSPFTHISYILYRSCQCTLKTYEKLPLRKAEKKKA